MRRMLLAICGLVAVGTAGAFLIAEDNNPLPDFLPDREQIRQEQERLSLWAAWPPLQPARLADPNIVFSENPDAAAADKTLYTTDVDVTEVRFESAESEPPSVRDQYVDLLRKKAELMSDEQIADSLEQLKGDISELEAERKLAEITGDLEKLVESHPETRAARRAQAMLATPDPGAGSYYPGTPTSSSHRPVPDAGYYPAFEGDSTPDRRAN